MSGGEPLGTLLLTHSSRRVNPARCSKGFLGLRFADPERLARLPPFESLPPAEALYSGALSLWRVDLGRPGVAGGRPRLVPLGAVASRDKIQHAVALGPDTLVVGFEHRIERWRLAIPVERLARRGLLTAREVAVERVFEHPRLAGLHTVEPLPGGRLAVSCSAPDAVLVVDLASGEVERTLRMPEDLYGRGYELAGRDLRTHYVGDEQQTTHLNSAHRDPAGRRLAVSTLIQGAVGIFDLDGDLDGGGYRELARGFVGCHGARFDARPDAAAAVYFSDSPAGRLVRLREDGRVAGRFDTGSIWLHDAIQVEGDLFAFAVADANELRLHDVGGENGAPPLARRRFHRWPFEGGFALARRWPGWLGNSIQALSFFPHRG